MKVAIYTLGCKVNQYETQAMEQTLRARGHKVVDFSSDADAYVVNTCSVTAVSDQKSRQVIHRAKRQHPAAVMAVCGCYPQTHAEAVRELEVDLIAGTGDREGFVTLLEEAAAGKKRLEAIDKSFERRTFEVLPAGGMEGRTRAMLKIEDGCVNFCSYCIIPYARGPVRSLPLERAVEQTRQLAAEGYREIVLTGIEISSWGHDLKNGLTLIDLLESLSAAFTSASVSASGRKTCLYTGCISGGKRRSSLSSATFSTSLYALRMAGLSYLMGVGISPVRISLAS
mgnify:CR=1 FL=1